MFKIVENLLHFNTNCIRFKIVCQRTEMTHQQRVSRSESRVIERAVDESRQRPPLAFVLEKDILACDAHVKLSK